MTDIPAAIKKLKITGQGIMPVSGLGFGASGVVFKVKMNDRFYALKISRLCPLEDKDAGGPILIQKALGEIDIAPEVLGVLDRNALEGWLKQYKDLIHELANNDPEIKGSFSTREHHYGVLMELTESVTLKFVNNSIKYGAPLNISLPPLSKKLYGKLVGQSEKYMKALDYLTINSLRRRSEV